jgi:hypothetical protein
MVKLIDTINKRREAIVKQARQKIIDAELALAREKEANRQKSLIYLRDYILNITDEIMKAVELGEVSYTFNEKLGGHLCNIVDELKCHFMREGLTVSHWVDLADKTLDHDTKRIYFMVSW